MKRRAEARPRGFFLVVEGADASGKTTLARRLAIAYRQQGWTVTSVREPGGTRLSESVRRILLDPKALVNPRSELFLYLAARAQLVGDVINPALRRGEFVIADRFSLSTLAYQVGGRGLPARAVMAADRLARAELNPDLTILLTVTEGQSRLRRQENPCPPDRIEREPASFFRAVRAEYLKLSRRMSGLIVVDSSIGADDVYVCATEHIDRRLKRRRPSSWIRH